MRFLILPFLFIYLLTSAQETRLSPWGVKDQTLSIWGIKDNSLGFITSDIPVPNKAQAECVLSGQVKIRGADTLLTDITGKHDTVKIIGCDWLSDPEYIYKIIPYRTKAVIVFPVSLKSFDVDSFMFNGNGVARQIPIISFFQNIDYANKIFCKEIAQVLNADSTEVHGAGVKYITIYSAIQAGTNLTACNTWFSVPVESTGNDVRWVMPTGSDASTYGYKATPWLTLQKALLTVNDGDIVYVKSFDPYRGHSSLLYLYNDKNNNIKSLGNSIVRGTALTYGVRIVNASMTLMERLSIIPDNTLSADILWLQTADLLVLNKIYIKTLPTKQANNGVKHQFVSINNSVVDIKVAQSGIDKSVGTNAYTINSCIVNLTSGTNGIIVNNNLGKATIKYNKITGTSQFGLRVDDATNACDIYRNVFNLTGTTASIFTLTNNSQLNITQNIFYLKPAHTSYNISITNAYGKQSVISDNIFNSTGTSNYGSLGSTNAYVKFSSNKLGFENIISSANGDIDLSGGANTVASVEIINNKIFSKRVGGYHCKIGSEVTSTANDKITAPIISKNYVKGATAYNVVPANSTHGLFIGFQKNGEISYNYVDGAGYSVVYKGNSSITSTTKGVYYNIFKNSKYGIYNNSVGVKFYNNTLFFNSLTPTCGFRMSKGGPGDADVADACIIKNNIVICLGTGDFYAHFNETAPTTPHVIDYNIYYCPNGNLRFIANGVAALTFAQWQALGYDTHSIVLTNEQYAGLFTDPANNNFSLKTGSLAIGIGVDLGTDYDDGLDSSTNWGSDTQIPTVVTKQQGVNWDIGAYIH